MRLLHQPRFHYHDHFDVRQRELDWDGITVCLNGPPDDRYDLVIDHHHPLQPAGYRVDRDRRVFVVTEPLLYLDYAREHYGEILEHYGVILSRNLFDGEPGHTRWQGAETWAACHDGPKRFGVSGYVSGRGQDVAWPVGWAPAAGYRLRADVLLRQWEIAIPSMVYNYAGSWRGATHRYPQPDKSAGMGWMFHLAIENSIEPWYFTEKLMDCFASGVVPLYFGDPELDREWDMDGVIQLDPDRWLSQVNDLSEDDYYSRLPAMAGNRARAERLYRDFPSGVRRALGQLGIIKPTEG